MPMSEANRAAASERMKQFQANRRKEKVEPPKQQLAAVNKRWESVKANREEWLKPFRELPVPDALAYLEDLRRICQDAGAIINERINDSSLHKECAFCKKSCDDRQLANGQTMPSYASVKSFKRKNNPEIWDTFYFCSAACDNGWVRKHGGQYGGTGQ